MDIKNVFPQHYAILLKDNMSHLCMHGIACISQIGHVNRLLFELASQLFMAAFYGGIWLILRILTLMALLVEECMHTHACMQTLNDHNLRAAYITSCCSVMVVGAYYWEIVAHY